MWKNNLIKHRNCLDIAFNVNVLEFHENYYQLKGYWINVTSVNKLFLGHDVIYIKKSDIDNWNVIYA